MVNVLIQSYAKMVTNGRCVIDQIPEEYREQVKKYLEDGNTEVKPPKETEITPEPDINGAIHIPNISTKISVSGDESEVSFTNDSIFTRDILGDLQTPSNIVYSIERIENVYGKFENDLNVEIDNTDDGFSIHISGTTKNIVPESVILRVDIRVKSSNFEDMRFTIYFLT